MYKKRNGIYTRLNYSSHRAPAESWYIRDEDMDYRRTDYSDSSRRTDDSRLQKNMTSPADYSDKTSRSQEDIDRNYFDTNIVDRYLARQSRNDFRFSEEYPASRSDLWKSKSSGAKSWELSSAKREQLQKQCHSLFFKNPLAGSILDIYSFFTLGKSSIKISWEDEHAQKWWNKIADRNHFRKLQRDIISLTYICGENFVVLFPLSEEEASQDAREGKHPDHSAHAPSNELRLDFVQVHPTEIEEVLIDDNDRRQVTGFKKTEGKILSTEDVVHLKVRDVGCRRGRPILERILKPLAMYDEWLTSRANINRTRSRLPVIRYRKGLKQSRIPIRSLPEPGSVIDAHQDIEEWEFPDMNINSAGAEADGQAMLTYISTGISIPLNMITGETTRSIPPVPALMFENFQATFKSSFHSLLKKSMPTFYKKNPPEINFGEVDLSSFTEKRRAILSEFQADIRSKRSAQIALGLDPQEEEKLMAEEPEPQVSTASLSDDLLRRIVSAVLFYAPAIQAGDYDNPTLEKVLQTFEEKGFI